MAAKEPIPPEVSLLPDEKIITTLGRRYPSIITSMLSFVITIAFTAWVYAVRYITQYFPSYLEIVVEFLYPIIFAVACLLALIALVGYSYIRGHLYVLTDRRIILFRKFITISVRELLYSEITDIIVNQGPIARLLNYGSVNPLSPGVRAAYVFPYPYWKRFSLVRTSLRDVSEPSKVMNKLFKLTRSNIDR